MNSEIKVSVCVVTYNQEKYIKQCLQSLVDQVTDFKFEIIVGEDNSTDNTRTIVEEFQAKYPDYIFPLFHDENLGAVRNCISTYKKAKGKYICHIDGDDYALPGKLQAQYIALEANPNCIICSHDMMIVNAHNSLVRKNFFYKKTGIYTLMDLYKRLPFFAHSSKMFRNNLMGSIWHDISDSTLDIEIHVLQAHKGNIYHIQEPLGAYRYSTGVTSTTQGVNPILIQGTQRVFEKALKTPGLNQIKIKEYYAAAIFKYAYISALNKDKSNLKKYIKESIEICPYSFTQKFFNYLSNFPRLIIFLCKLRAKLKGYKEI